MAETKLVRREERGKHFFFSSCWKREREREGRELSLSFFSFKMSLSSNSSVHSWQLHLAKILGVSPEALLVARGGGMSGNEISSSPSPSSSPASTAHTAPPPLVLYDVTAVTDRQIVNG